MASWWQVGGNSVADCIFRPLAHMHRALAAIKLVAKAIFALYSPSSHVLTRLP